MRTRGRPPHPDVLTPREWEVLTLVREGLTNPQIAERLGITRDAAKYHVSEILSKLHLGSREEAAAWQPEPPRATVLRPSWANALSGWWPWMARTAGAVAIVAAVAGLGLLAYGVMTSEGEDEPIVEAAATAAASPGPPTEAEASELLNGFIAARVAGQGAEQYLNSLYPDVPPEEIPLLYATSSGVPYERGEFEPVPDVEWPYGFRAFKVRLFAGDSVVEQLFFMPYDDPEYFPTVGRPGLEYQPHGFATDIAPATENGRPVPLPYSDFGGEVSLHAAHPWVFVDGDSGYGRVLGRLIPEGVGPTTDGGSRNEWAELILMADPAAVEVEGGCQIGPTPADAEALAASIRSYPLEATFPVAVSAGVLEGLMLDVKISAGAIICGPSTIEGNVEDGVLSPVFDQDAPFLVDVDDGLATGVATGEWMRLYLFDTPEGSAMRILAIAIVAPESDFARAVEAAQPVVDSLEFRAP